MGLFLAAHSTGFFADLARAARDKITAAEQRVTMGKEKAAEEETKRKAAEAARVRAAEEARLKAEADAKKTAEEEARRKAIEEARFRAADEARLKAEEAARRFAEEEAKLKAKLEAVAKSQHAPTVIASAPSAPETTRALAPQMDEGDIARLLQFHLKRVGCDPGTVDGKWTDQSAHAMAEFNKRAKANFEVKVASLGALDAVKQQKARLCPLVCGKGFKVEEDRCIAEACRRGFVRNKASGECERETKAAASPAPRDEGGNGSGGGQIFCSERGGCKAVPKNCRIVHCRGTGERVCKRGRTAAHLQLAAGAVVDVRTGACPKGAPLLLFVALAMSAFPSKMPALPPKADMCGATRDVRFVPIADMRPPHSITSSALAISESGRSGQATLRSSD